ncbi:MAG: YqgE/AlgH family protein [Propionibacteriales bacterium]|nr:YqgE/AlgH family protein [Propionibacteriales bacterium]
MTLTGQLLVASPRLVDPNFDRAVLFILDDDDDGSLGVVINRPSRLPLSVVLPAWAQAVTEPPMLFSGGPVAEEAALAVGLALGAGPPIGFKRLTGCYGLVDLDVVPEALLGDLSGVRVFSGYAGWGEGQLEEEIAEGSWYVVEALPSDLLSDEPERLWRTVLRRQPGELAYLSTFPDDPTMN